MRLLNVHTRQLEEFSGKDIPPYAILSHTWGKDEVALSDINSTTVQKKAGYGKIDYTCREAARQNMEYCWIDTCCIDKSSSSELSEAINSMFSWYNDAKVCYAYLEDVDSLSPSTEPPYPRWFTRGWTLQELLAPRRVEFYGRNWVKLGFKDTESSRMTEFTQTLARITGIDELVLWKPTYMRGKSVAARMSWASKRITTRPEDLSYCLLGIFGVNMPLLYGEGDRAFIRLQEEIIKLSDDHSIFAWDRDLSDTGSVSCLANSPSWFDRGAHVVPFGRKRLHSTPYTITNQGLQIQLPLIQKAHSEIVYGLINCHWENTLFGCIGIPLRGSLNSIFFERSSHHQPRTIPLTEMAVAQTRTIFLSTRPPVDLPFAAEVNLQVYDTSLKACGFLDLEITNNPMASHHWHPEYENFRLRWLSTNQATCIRSVSLLWTHGTRPNLGLAVCIQGRVDGHGNGDVGRFIALKIGMTSRVASSHSWVDELVEQLNQDSNDHRVDSDILLNTTYVLNLDRHNNSQASTVEIRAELRQQDIFGNEVYTLAIEVNP
jgi:Heterokaryon incompatibility protein (HET)